MVQKANLKSPISVFTDKKVITDRVCTTYLDLSDLLVASATVYLGLLFLIIS